jgi:hypothetical protein
LRVLVDEHLTEWDGELLLHLLMSDVLRVVVESFAAGEFELTADVLRVVERGLLRGDEYVNNAISVSFVEHFGAGPGETSELLASWPPALREELHRQNGS